MDDSSTSRRTLLKLAGGTVTVGSLAGCSSLPFSSGSGPPYRDWVPAESPSTFAYLATSGQSVERTDIADASNLEQEADALAGLFLLYAGYGSVTLTLGSGVGVLRNATLAALVPDDVKSGLQDSAEAESESAESTPENSTIEGVLVAGDALVLYGDIDVTELQSAIEPTYEKMETRDGYTIFARPGEADPAQFAAGDDAVVLPIGADSDAIVSTMLDTVAGDGDRFVEQGQIGSAVDSAGSGQLVYGSLDPTVEPEQGENDSFDLGSLFEEALPWEFQTDATGVVSSTGYDGDAVVGEAAFVYDQEDDVPAKSTIEDQITPTSAAEYDVSIDGTEVVITGEWSQSSEESSS